MDNDDILLHLLKSNKALDNSLMISEMKLESLEEVLKEMHPKIYQVYRHTLFLKMKEAFPSEYASFCDHY